MRDLTHVFESRLILQHAASDQQCLTLKVSPAPCRTQWLCGTRFLKYNNCKQQKEDRDIDLQIFCVTSELEEGEISEKLMKAARGLSNILRFQNKSPLRVM